MSDTQTFSYKVIRGSIKKPRGSSKRPMSHNRDFFMEGDMLPDGIYTPADIESWLDEGRIASVSLSNEQAIEEVEKIKVRGKFRVDPASLVGKSLADMRIMVTEIAPEIDASSIADERMAVSLLTSDWDPRYKQPIAPVSDRSRPEALIAHDLKQGEDGESATRSSPGRAMSDGANERHFDNIAKAKEAAESAKAEQIDTPVEGNDTPVEGNDTPVEGNDTPVEGNDAPAEQPSAIDRARAEAANS